MEMRWLKFGLLTAVLLTAACGRQPDGISQTDMQAESAVLRGVTYASPRLEQMLAAPLTPAIDELPPLPFSDQRVRFASAVTTVTRDGSNSYKAGGGAVNVGTSK